MRITLASALVLALSFMDGSSATRIYQLRERALEKLCCHDILYLMPSVSTINVSSIPLESYNSNCKKK
jgi:hypothetical protein